MAYTYPPTYYESTSAPANSRAGLKDFVLFANGTHPTQTNAIKWACIDCYDGTTREQPASGSLSNLTAGNLWRSDTSTPAQNAWAVFQAPSGGDVVKRYQLYVEMGAGDTVFLGVFMLNDWDVGAGADATPDIPTVSLGVPPFAGGMDGAIANHTDFLWKAIVDEGGIILDVFPTVSGTREWLYIGDLESDNPISLDSRPFIVSSTPDGSNWASIFLHVAESDDSTIINTNDEVELEAGMSDAQDRDAFTRRPLCSVAVYANEAGDRYRKGKLRNCGAMSRHARTADNVTRITAGVGAAEFTFEVWGRVDSQPHMVTLFPPGIALDSHVQVPANSIPKQLVP